VTRSLTSSPPPPPPPPRRNPITGNPYDDLGARDWTPQGQASSGTTSTGGAIINNVPDSLKARAASVASGSLTPSEVASGVTTSASTIKTTTIGMSGVVSDIGGQAIRTRDQTITYTPIPAKPVTNPVGVGYMSAGVANKLSQGSDLPLYESFIAKPSSMREDVSYFATPVARLPVSANSPYGSVSLYTPESYTDNITIPSSVSAYGYAPKVNNSLNYNGNNININQEALKAFNKGGVIGIAGGVTFATLAFGFGAGKTLIGIPEFFSPVTYGGKLQVPVISPTINFVKSIPQIPTYAATNPFEFAGNIGGMIIGGKVVGKFFDVSGKYVSSKVPKASSEPFVTESYNFRLPEKNLAPVFKETGIYGGFVAGEGYGLVTNQIQTQLYPKVLTEPHINVEWGFAPGKSQLPSHSELSNILGSKYQTKFIGESSSSVRPADVLKVFRSDNVLKVFRSENPIGVQTKLNELVYTDNPNLKSSVIISGNNKNRFFLNKKGSSQLNVFQSDVYERYRMGGSLKFIPDLTRSSFDTGVTSSKAFSIITPFVLQVQSTNKLQSVSSSQEQRVFSLPKFDISKINIQSQFNSQIQSNPQRQIQPQAVIQTQISSQSQIQTPISISSLIVSSSFFTPPPPFPISNLKPPSPPIVAIPNVPKLPFFSSSDSGVRPGVGSPFSFRSSRRTRYAPSFSALVFKIPGKYKASKFSKSGMDFRPVTKGYKLFGGGYKTSEVSF